MRRADRLFQTVQLIRGRRLTTAAFPAQRLEVSERTVCRDVADLQRKGVPIEDEPGKTPAEMLRKVQREPPVARYRTNGVLRTTGGRWRPI
jgi:predicted DNA-binding transcriptional regulator YafY